MQFLELRIPPVAQVIIFAIAMWVLSTAFPGFYLAIPGAQVAVLFFLVAGSAVALLGVREFSKAGTTVDPRFPEKANNLVLGGIYRYTRNPMYLGLFLLLLGWACYLRHGLPFLVLPLFVAYMNRFQIKPEERHMIQRFGDDFSAYAARVRRWI